MMEKIKSCGIHITQLYTELSKRLYVLWYGHPYLIENEVKITCETRDEQMFKNLSEFQIKALIKRKIVYMYDEYKKQQKCQHERWTCDTQIRTIECNTCGKRAWLEDYKTLYK